MNYDDLTERVEEVWSEPALAVLAKLTRERDQARGIACALEQECAKLTELVSDLQGQVVVMEFELAQAEDTGKWPS